MAGADIMHLAAEAKSRVDPRDAAMMLEAVDADAMATALSIS